MHDVKRNVKNFGVIAFVVLASFSLIMSQPLAFAQQPREATDETAASMRETQQIAVQPTTTDQQTAGNTQYTSRWSPVIVADPGTLTAIFADCKPGEFAVSEQHLFETRNIELVHSLSAALPDNFMVWLGIVFNWGDEPLDASIGVVCADDAGKAVTGVDLDYTTKLTINNIVNQIIQQQGNINIQYISLIYQKITQNAIQIINVTGNNNTVNAVINQTAGQILAQNATTPAQIDAIVNATAQDMNVPLPSANTTGTTGGVAALEETPIVTTPPATTEEETEEEETTTTDEEEVEETDEGVEETTEEVEEEEGEGNGGNGGDGGNGGSAEDAEVEE